MGTKLPEENNVAFISVLEELYLFFFIFTSKSKTIQNDL